MARVRGRTAAGAPEPARRDLSSIRSDRLRAPGLVYACGCSRADIARRRLKGRATTGRGTPNVARPFRAADCARRAALPRHLRRPRAGRGPGPRASGAARADPSSASSICGTARRSSGRRSSAATCWCATARATGRISSRRPSTIFVQGVTLVIRGDDLLASTGRQFQLARLLGRAEPPRVPASPADHEIAGSETEQIRWRHRRPRPARARLDACSG